MTEMDDGRVEVPTVHDPIVGSLAERDQRESKSSCSGRASGTALASPFPLSVGFNKIRGLA